MNIVIIGSSAASKSAVTTLLKEKKSDINITVVSRDSMFYYSRVLLPNYIAGEIEEERLLFVDESFFEDKRLNFIKGNVTNIDGIKKKIFIEGYGSKNYDKLIITTGARPVMPYGDNVEGVCCLRDLEDAVKIKKIAQKAQNCIVIGGGLVSLKAAWALNEIGKKVTVLVESNRVLSRAVDFYCSLIVTKILRDHGINIILSSKIKGLSSEAGKLKGVVLDDGSLCPCDLVVVGKGVKPDVELARNCGIKVDRGIVVDNNMATSLNDVYAAGDVAQSHSLLDGDCELFTLWPDAMEQGKIAAYHILGNPRSYLGGISMNSVKFYGVPFISIGKITENVLINCSVHINKNDVKKVYRKIIVRDNKILGAVFAGDVSYAGMVYWDIKSGRRVETPQKYLTREGLEELYLIRNKQL
ncbi:NAD(P)/FAD-dependent oxidoreductase [Lutispora sp.]|uniref:NAD(P)/FAD-dependent oxidoreductase n=1 Tax=Lutispora sp. TaxID=2828727 RepID=UPI003568A785